MDFISDPGNPIIKITVGGLAITYLDRTADVEDKDAFQRIMNARKGQALAQRKTAEVIDRVLADPANPHPISDVRSELEALRNHAKSDHSGESAGELAGILGELEGLATRSWGEHTTGVAYLKDYASKQREASGMLMLHAQIGREK